MKNKFLKMGLIALGSICCLTACNENSKDNTTSVQTTTESKDTSTTNPSVLTTTSDEVTTTTAPEATTTKEPMVETTTAVPEPEPEKSCYKFFFENTDYYSIEFPDEEFDFGSIEEGSTVTFRIRIMGAYDVKDMKVYVNDTELSPAGDAYSFIMSEDATLKVEATFTKKPTTVYMGKTLTADLPTLAETVLKDYLTTNPDAIYEVSITGNSTVGDKTYNRSYQRISYDNGDDYQYDLEGSVTTADYYYLKYSKAFRDIGTVSGGSYKYQMFDNLSIKVSLPVAFMESIESAEWTYEDYIYSEDSNIITFNKTFTVTSDMAYVNDIMINYYDYSSKNNIISFKESGTATVTGSYNLLTGELLIHLTDSDVFTSDNGICTTDITFKAFSEVVSEDISFPSRDELNTKWGLVMDPEEDPDLEKYQMTYDICDGVELTKRYNNVPAGYEQYLQFYTDDDYEGTLSLYINDVLQTPSTYVSAAGTTVYEMTFIPEGDSVIQISGATLIPGRGPWSDTYNYTASSIIEAYQTGLKSSTRYITGTFNAYVDNGTDLYLNEYYDTDTLKYYSIISPDEMKRRGSYSTSSNRMVYCSTNGYQEGNYYVDAADELISLVANMSVSDLSKSTTCDENHFYTLSGTFSYGTLSGNFSMLISYDAAEIKDVSFTNSDNSKFLTFLSSDDYTTVVLKFATPSDITNDITYNSSKVTVTTVDEMKVLIDSLSLASYTIPSYTDVINGK